MTFSLAAQRLSALAERPDWTALEAFQETITREDFARLLEKVYAPNDAARGLIEIGPDAATIKTSLTPVMEFRLRFASDSAHAKAPPRSWRGAAEMPATTPDRPLAGVKIAIDAGHLGGQWAHLEERFFQIGESRPVAEGDMTLRVAQLLVPRLEALGATVQLVRSTSEPATELRPETLHEAAKTELVRNGVVAPRENYESPNDAARSSSVQGESELLFYRVSEIRERAKRVNTKLQPDLVLCLHFNAEAWGDPAKPEFVPRNHLHALVNGCYSAAELRFDDQRFEMLRKLLTRTYSEELALSENVATQLALTTQLPPYIYPQANALRVGTGPYVWARNLLANRLYQAPVAFFEPYVMNSEGVWARVQAGDYEGELWIDGRLRPSIYREYADAVTAGLRTCFSANRPTKSGLSAPEN